jgi:hypothetical protein
MADHAAPSTSPKVTAPLLTGLALTFFAAGLAAVTPETLTFLGPWALPVYAGIVATAGYITGYLKRDPLREAGAAAQQAEDAEAAPLG